MKRIQTIFLFLIILSIPLLLTTTSIRMALSPIYINLEYRLPGFPEDPYGFSTEERLHWAQISINYLMGRITHEEFSSLRLPDGTLLFNAREIYHMLDVRILTEKVLLLWGALLIFSVLSIIACLKLGILKKWLQAVRTGSALTVLLILAVLLYVAIDFNRLFTQFHMIFFVGDSWLFPPSDSLIRLFPLRFWQDLFIFLGAVNFFSASLLYWVTGRKLSKGN